MDRKKLLGRRIKELRKVNGFTQDYLAEKLGIEPRQLSKLENGKHYPSFETIVSLLETFNISFEELITYEHLNEVDYRDLIIKDVESLDNQKSRNVYKVLRALVN